MNLNRIVSRVAVALLTFAVGVTLTLLWLSQRRGIHPQQTHSSAVSTDSVVHDQASKKDVLLKEVKFPRVWSEAVTVTGKLEVVESDFLTWKVSLNGKEILSSDENGSLPPSVEKHVRSRIKPFDEVVILTQVDGNCCELRRFWFLGLRADGSYLLPKAIGDGFVHGPGIVVGEDSVKVKIRSGYDPRPDVGFMRGGVWMFKNGKVKRLR